MLCNHHHITTIFSLTFGGALMLVLASFWAGCGHAHMLQSVNGGREVQAPVVAEYDGHGPMPDFSALMSKSMPGQATDPNQDICDVVVNRMGTVRNGNKDRIGMDLTEFMRDMQIDSTFEAEDNEGTAVLQRAKKRSMHKKAAENAEINPAVNRFEMMKEIVSVLEISYLWGGTNAMRGLDCSAFVGTVYSRAFGVRLPRTSNAQFTTGSRIKRDRLLIGDLVFFSIDRSRGPVSHVGIYVGEGLFAHAGARGVTVSELGRPMYRRSWAGARRILQAPARALRKD
jgi:hypothetical protein